VIPIQMLLSAEFMMTEPVTELAQTP